MKLSTALTTGALALGLTTGLGATSAQAEQYDYRDGYRNGYHHSDQRYGDKHYHQRKHYERRYFRIRGRYYRPDYWDGRRVTVVNRRGNCISRKVYYDGRGRYAYETRKGTVYARPYIYRGELIFARPGWQPNHFRPVAYVHRDGYRPYRKHGGYSHSRRDGYYKGYQHSYRHNDDSDVGALIFGAAVLGLVAAAASN